MNPGEIIVQIDGGIGLMPRHGSEIAAAKLGVIEPTETHIRQSICGIEQWQGDPVLGQ